MAEPYSLLIDQRTSRLDAAQQVSLARGKRPWKRCFAPADQIETPGSDWAPIECLPGIHVVGKTPNAKCEVAGGGSCIEWLFSHDFSFELPSKIGVQRDVAEPTTEEVGVHGAGKAKGEAKSRRIDNATNGILVRTWWPGGGLVTITIATTPSAKGC